MGDSEGGQLVYEQKMAEYSSYNVTSLNIGLSRPPVPLKIKVFYMENIWETVQGCVRVHVSSLVFQLVSGIKRCQNIFAGTFYKSTRTFATTTALQSRTLPVNIPTVCAPASWAARHTIVCLDTSKYMY